ncbi:penicillin acylase family protein [Leptospira sp. GIMC2001]|uniref:penicillin acylase family protein n=1 Tax=Leptospira sp. GIMC2001 TaxID=1513297 RepID=UPI00234AB3DF|nr:penicillin acylase family protein [Leptospira sp. GIMC2001]WCL48252.1 penicillin acylase family protein [Leptospira sp. GIMC2001]
MKWALGLPVFLALVVMIVWESLLLIKSPLYNGEIQVAGIKEQVEVIRDLDGVPHIDAKSPHSAFYALGYVSAQDRLFQMEIIRRLAQGRLAEILGEDLVPVDRMFRSLLLGDWARKYAQDQARLEPDAWTNLDSYLEGVNAFVSQGNYPIEFTVLGFTPEPFRREDALASLAYMGFSFAEGIRTDSLYSILAEKFPNSKIEDLFPRMDKEKDASIMEDQPGIPRLSTYIEDKQIIEKNPELRLPLNSTNRSSDSVANVNRRELERFVSNVDSVFNQFPPIDGSNSWVLAGSRTQSGKPILVNDPHIAYSNPGTWYEAHLKYPGLNVYGYFLAGVPYPLVGNTEDKAWGLTMLENDDVDLYYETISENGMQVYHKNQWKDLQIIEEEIKIKGKDSEKYTIRITPHGPIYTDFVKGYEGKPISLSWVFHKEHSPVIEVLHRALFSKGLKGMKEAISLLTAPGLNFSYADREGNIGWWGAGRFPIRNKISNTRKILDGSQGDADIVGYLNFSENPQLENPKNGIIATANNLPSKKNYARLGRLEGNWQPSDRFRRITEVLSKKEKFDYSDMENLLVDITSYSAPEIWEVYINSIKIDGKIWENQSPQQINQAKEAMDILSQWNFQGRVDSKGATVYYVLTYHVIRNMLLDEMGEETLKIYGSTAEYINAFKWIIEQEDHPLWDNVATDGRETRDEILEKSLIDTVEYLTKNVSETPNLWLWKNLYKVEYPHAIGMKKPMNLIFNIGPHSTMGAPEVVNNVKMKLLDGKWLAASGPSTRRVVSFGDMDENRTILPTGNSGNMASPFYDDQTMKYINGEFRTTNFTPEKINKEKRYKLILKE